MSAPAAIATASPSAACRTGPYRPMNARMSAPFAPAQRNVPGPLPAPGRMLREVARDYDCVAAAATVFFIHSVVTLLGRSIGVPIARLMMSCDSMPIARDTENSTV